MDNASVSPGFTRPPRLSVARIVAPGSIAVVGASDDLKKFGGRIIHYVTRNGYRGTVIPVNPRRAEVAGLPAVPSIAHLGPVDVAILALPVDMIEQAIGECAAAGVGACVIVSAGFAELGDEGVARQDRIVRIAREAGMRLVGPNCMGIINPHHRMALTSSLVVEQGELLPGNIGLISQSGALMVSMYDRACREQIRFSACVSLGNQCDLEICDFFEYMIDDPLTRVITMYVEGFVDTGRFAELARRAQRAGKPVLLTKTGRTAAGAEAARSHTASLAGNYRALEALCEATGVTIVDDPDGMLQLAAILARFGRCAAEGVGIVSPSGGAIGIGVDRLSDVGIRLGRLDAASQQLLGTVMNPSHAFNPVDLGNRTTEEMSQLRTIVQAYNQAPDIGVIFVILTTSPHFEQVTLALGQAMAQAGGKPVLFLVTPGGVADNCRTLLQDLGLPYVDRMDDAIRILRHYVPKADALPARDAPRPASWPMPEGAGRMLGARPGEPEVKALLRAYGIPLAQERFCRTAEQAVEAARAIGFPVVLKAVSAQLVHKSDIGAVKLRLADDAAVRRAWAEIEQALSSQVDGAVLDGCLVAEMVTAQSELLVGAINDAQFGPMIMVGFGGVTVELVPDTQLAVAPVDTEQAMALLRRLNQWPLLDGYRGMPKADVAAVAEVVSRVSWLIADLRDQVAELDINPLLIRAGDGKPIGVDARAAMLGPG
ncbi:CoA-binding protein [Bordetella bronchiseptica]|uniref:acetate--CoA ligase family protein n=1 Tax=Bordetella bronchiseptica TaxID=518 RepID=UPI0005291107|nr:acetate--CoA ligase family protein [Bordetella bronchiseptica]AZW14848.1 CoA-binding protein [Bordetella bronchiseptica]QBS71384.1 acetyl-CoA synthetase [Bordetella bronchiseptica]